MPWVDEGKCVGCGICVVKCPPKAVSLAGNKARINMDECIRCGTCHSVCPVEAVRHDSELIPGEVKANVSMTLRFMEACEKALGKEQESRKCLERMKKHFNKQKIVAEKTLEELARLG